MSEELKLLIRSHKSQAANCRRIADSQPEGSSMAETLRQTADKHDRELVRLEKMLANEQSTPKTGN